MTMAGAALLGCSKPSPMPIQVRDVELKLPQSASTPESKRVLVVCNNNSKDSVELTEYYAAKRGIHKANIVQVSTTISETVSTSDYKWTIEEPVKKALKGRENQIDFIVTTKGVPIRINDKWGLSVDSMLAAHPLKRKPPLAGTNPPDLDERNTMVNPYFNARKPFTRKEYGYYLVTRLDGYLLNDAKKLVDNSLAAKRAIGLFFFDRAGNRNNGGYEMFNILLSDTTKLLKDKKMLARVDETPEFVAPAEPLMGYVSWGSNDNAYNLETYKSLRFRPGALAETFVSFGGRSFTPQTSGQSMIADLISKGVTGVKGYVSEPWLFAMAVPPILFDRYTDGYNLAESYYCASPVIGWKDIIIGDPLCRPFAKK